MKKLVLSAITLSFLTVGSCTPAADQFGSLSNNGILALSNSNPYLGSNLFIGQEASKSEYLYNFLEGRGSPSAIEVMNAKRGEARIIMYYPREKEVYISDLAQDETSREWVTRGPFPVQRKDYRALMNMDTSMNGEPVYVIRGQEHRFRFQRPIQQENVLQPSITILPRPTPAPIIKKKKPTAPIIVAKGPEPTPTPFAPMNSDQQAIAMNKGLAERTSSGDVIHSVGKDGETLASIAKWYTGNESNEAQIATASGVDKATPLKAGTRITIPMSLVKEFKKKS